jgi:hypothetical protein
MGWITTTYRRSDLFQQVWTEPMRDVAKRYGVSDVALKKTCRKLRVPLPDAGHWNKRPERRDATPNLPPLPDGMAAEITVHREESVPYQEPSLPPALAELMAKERAADARIMVAATLAAPHALVTATGRVLRKRTPDLEGLVRAHLDEACLDVRVSPAQLDRLLRIMDALLKALDRRGLSVRVRIADTARRHDTNARRGPEHEPMDATRVQVSGVWITLRVVEKLKMERLIPADKPWHWSDGPRVRYLPKGIFELTATCGNQGATWLERPTRPLEQCLNDVVARLHVLAHRHHEARAAEAQHERRRQEEARRQREEAERRAAEEAREQELREDVQAWELARSIRAYVADAHAIVAAGGCALRDDSELANHLRWATTYADRIDPFSGLREEVAERTAAPTTPSMES